MTIWSAGIKPIASGPAACRPANLESADILYPRLDGELPRWAQDYRPWFSVQSLMDVLPLESFAV